MIPTKSKDAIMKFLPITALRLEGFGKSSPNLVNEFMSFKKGIYFRGVTFFKDWIKKFLRIALLNTNV
jgi:hypothetical protein